MGSDAPRSEAPPSRSRQGDALVGRVVAERYRILAPLAKGGMGAVYRAEHVHMHKEVAIKVLHPESENLPELVARFERESVVGAHAKHVNVATATDFGKDSDGSYYLVLELIGGITLAELLRRGPIDVGRAVDIARQIARGLEAIHALGIYHRDLNPRNVMVSEAPPDAVKLIDFGFAKVPIERFSNEAKSAAVLTSKGVVFGTIGYVAPESAFGMHAVGQAADLYALGVLLYEMLTGEHPYDKSDQKELYRCHQMEPPPPFHDRAPERDAPAELEKICMRLLEKAPRDRYGSAEEVLEALDEAFSAPPPPPARPVSRRTREPVSEESAQPAQLDVSPRPAKKKRPMGLWAFAAGLTAALALIILVPSLRKHITGGETAPTATAPAPAPLTASQAQPSAMPSVAPSVAPSAAPSVARPTSVDGKDAQAWRDQLRSAVIRSDAGRATDSVFALAQIDPARFGDPNLLADTAAAANLAAQGDEKLADKVFSLLASDALGAYGPDVLYRLTSLHGGSRGARRAAELLAAESVRKNASKALLVAMALRDAPCSARLALLERAGQEGDERALLLLLAMRGESCNPCCMNNEPRLDAAIRAVRERQ
jgi:serine/threonine protein kinase